jgi:eukaryotic-like serine/threonine-protein kinase
MELRVPPRMVLDRRSPCGRAIEMVAFRALATRLTSGMWITPHVRLVRQLSVGGGGLVWVAAHMRMHTQVAVKFLGTHLLNDPTARARFEREGRVVSQIDSPYLVQVYDTGALEDGTPWMVMEWLEGESLKERMKKTQRLVPRNAMSVIHQVSQALSRTHQVGVVHRDIKPDNIFVLRTSGAVVIKLLDFGVAKRMPVGGESLSVITARQETLGTPAFMSPEQLRHASQADYRTDLWSLGVLAYRMLIGALPFLARDYPAMCLAITRAEFTLPSALDPAWPKEVDAWFARSFKIDRAARFRSAEEASTSLALALAPLGDHQPSGADDDELSARAERLEDAKTIPRQPG